MKKYRIAWRVKKCNDKGINGEGHGQYVFDSDNIDQAVDDANKRFPEINHWKELDWKSDLNSDKNNKQ